MHAHMVSRVSGTLLLPDATTYTQTTVQFHQAFDV